MKLKARALQWLSQREHSRSELRAKLLRTVRRAAAAAGIEAEAEAETAEVDALLDWLEQHQYLSPARFVESRVQARASRQGNRRILGELAMHGLAPDAATLERLQQSEYGRALALWRRRFAPAATLTITSTGCEPADGAATHDGRGADPAEKARQMRFLVARGFPADVIRRVLQAAPEDDQDAAQPSSFAGN